MTKLLSQPSRAVILAFSGRPEEPCMVLSGDSECFFVVDVAPFLPTKLIHECDCGSSCGLLCQHDRHRFYSWSSPWSIRPRYQTMIDCVCGLCLYGFFFRRE